MTLNVTGQGQGRPPPQKKEEVIPKVQMIDPKGQAVIPANPKLSDVIYQYRFPSSTTTTTMPKSTTKKTKTFTVATTTTSMTTTTMI